MPGMTALGVEKLGIIRGERRLFGGVSFGVAAGGALLLHGPNGSGKSSLLRLLAGFLAPAEGIVRWQGADAAEDPEPFRAAAIYIGHQDAVKPQVPARENLAFHADLQGGVHAEQVDAALEAVGLARQKGLPGRYLSAGQRRRLALARLLISRARVWLLDEPTNALDAAAIDWLGQAMAVHRAGGGIVLVASHVPVPLPGAQVLHLPDGRIA